LEVEAELVHRRKKRPHRASRSGALLAKRMGATTYELDSSHVPMLSQPEPVLDVIRTAAKGIQGAAATA
jgi:hypothetical protein